jgi:hypothetical protein
VPALTADQLEDAARAAEDEAEQHERKAVALREHARLLREAKGTAPKGLTIGSNHARLSSNVQLDLSSKSARVKNAGTRTRKGSPAKQALLLSGHTDKDLAEACAVGRSTVNAWMNGTRAIPPQHVKTAARPPFNIPLLSWPKRAAE